MKPKPKRIAKPGERHRRDNGPEALEVAEVAPPSPAQLGTAHLYTTTVLEGGPRALIAAEHEAARLSQKFGEEMEAKWCLATKFLLSLNQSTADQRARARYAMQWRPRFLAVVALTRSLILGSRAARVSKNTVLAHRRDDPDFDAQVVSAQEQAVDLLADMTMRTAIEGECKPIFWQGIMVGHQREFDNRLRIEMLRAYKPDRFKTPGSKVNINTGNQILGDNVIFDGPVLDNLIAMRQESLRLMAEKRANAIEVGTSALPPVPPAA